MEKFSVPFSSYSALPDHSGYARVTGLLRCDETELVVEILESTTSYETMAQEKHPLRTFHVPISDVESLEVRWRFPWGTRVVLRTHSLAALDGLPNADGARAVFNIARRDRLHARELASVTKMTLVDRRLRELGEGSSS